MLLSDSLVRIRRLLRDTTGNIFSDSALLRIWNSVNLDAVSRSGILERSINLPVPATAWTTFTHEWERDYVSRPSSMVYNSMGSFTYTQPWEVLSDVGLTPAVVGGITATQSWEGFYVTVQNRIRHYFPEDFDSLVYTAYNNKPIETVNRKSVDAVDSTSFKRGSGAYPVLYSDDMGNDNKTFYLYHRVDGVYGVVDTNSDYGEVCYDDNGDYNPTSDYGVVVFGVEDYVESNYGLSVQHQVSKDALYMIYHYLPQEIFSIDEVITVPRFIVKYIEYGVLGICFNAETDIFNEILAKQFTNMYNRGVKILENLMSKKRSLRTYKMSSAGGVLNRTKKLADVPSHYPSYWR